MRADLNFVQGAIVLGITVILALRYGAFDRGIGIGTAGIVFHKKYPFKVFCLLALLA